MRGPAILLVSFACFRFGGGAPAIDKTAKNLVLIPARYIPIGSINPYQTQLRGPLSFIGDWINNSEWFPIEINVPDTFGAIGSGLQGFGNGIGNIAQTAGTNFGNFAQGVGNNWNNFAQNFGNRFQNLTQRIPILNQINRPVAMAQATKFGTKYMVVLPQDDSVPNSDDKNSDKLINDISFDPFETEDIFSTFP